MPNHTPQPRLRIALLAPLVSPIAPPFLGGAQVLIHDLAVGLAGRGHHVTLFAATGSRLDGAAPVEIVEIPVQPGELSPTDFTNAPEPTANPTFFRQSELFLQMFLKLKKAYKSFDIAHAHAFDWPAFAFGPLTTLPTVQTVHLPSVDPTINALLAMTYRETGYSQAVTVSQACAATFGETFRFDRVIYNGIDTSRIPFGAHGEGFLLFAGRLALEKGADLAIKIAQAARRRLVMVGGIYDRAFFEKEIAPALAADPRLEYRGQLDRTALYELMSQADAVLFPSRWAEPFGLVLAESLAAGTPVISWKQGAAPEIIEPERTGFLLPFEDIAGAAAALDRLAQIDRRECRRQIEERFSLEKMLDAYEDYYSEVISRQ